MDVFNEYTKQAQYLKWQVILVSRGRGSADGIRSEVWVVPYYDNLSDSQRVYQVRYLLNSVRQEYKVGKDGLHILH
jgi:hypothetical protein